MLKQQYYKMPLQDSIYSHTYAPFTVTLGKVHCKLKGLKDQETLAD